MLLTLVIDFGAVLSSKALVLQSFIIHIKLFHHIVIELVPTSPSTAPERQRKTKKDRGQRGRFDREMEKGNVRFRFKFITSCYLRTGNSAQMNNKL